MTDAEVIIVGGGPTGLMLACELRLAGVRPLLLERRTHLDETPKAGGLGGQILRLLRHRGLLDRLEAACPGHRYPPPIFPFGGVHLDLSHLPDPPLRGLSLPQARLEQVLAERARELGAEVRRGHEVLDVRGDDAEVTVRVSGPDGPYRASADYLVGCDGAYSRIRERAGIPFPGITYPEVNRVGQVTVPESVVRLDNGDLDIAGVGTVRAGFTTTERGMFALGWGASGVLMIQTTEDESVADRVIEDEMPMTPAELQQSILRVLGVEIPFGEPIRLSRFLFQARQAVRYRSGRILLAGDAAHLFPATGVALNTGLLDTVDLAWKLAAEIQGWAPAGLLDSYHDERHFAGARTLFHTSAQVALRRGHDPAAVALREVVQELLADDQPARRLGALIAGADIRYPLPGAERSPLAGAFLPDLDPAVSAAALLDSARPVLLDLADRPELRAAARDWHHRVEVRTTAIEQRPADALLIRPDAHIAWVAPIGEPADTAIPALRGALEHWFGLPVRELHRS